MKKRVPNIFQVLWPAVFLVRRILLLITRSFYNNSNNKSNHVINITTTRM